MDIAIFQKSADKESILSSLKTLDDAFIGMHSSAWLLGLSTNFATVHSSTFSSNIPFAVHLV